MADAPEKIKLELTLTSKESDYLWASVVEFYHKMQRAADEEKLVVGLDERVLVARSLWKKVERTLGIE